MSKLIETYIGDLEARLAPHVGAERRQEILRELHSHLWMSRQGAIEELRMLPDQADETAMKLMGSPEVLAEDLIRRESGIEAKSAWKLARVPLILLVLAQIVPWVMIGRAAHQFFWLIDWFNYAVITSFIWAVWRSRRWLIAPMATTVVVLTLVLGAAMLFTPMSTWTGASAAESKAGFQRQLADLERDIAGAKLAMKGDLSTVKGPEGFKAPEPGTMENSIALPYIPASIKTTSSTPWYAWPSVASEKEARAKWLLYDEGYLAQLNDEVRKTKEGLDALLSDTPTTRVQNLNVTRFALMISYHTLVLTGANAAVLLLLSRRRRKKVTLQRFTSA